MRADELDKIEARRAQAQADAVAFRSDLRALVRHFGTQRVAAGAIGCSPGQVSNLLAGRARASRELAGRVAALRASIGAAT